MVPLLRAADLPARMESPGSGALKLLGEAPSQGTGVGVIPIGLGAFAVALGDRDALAASVVDVGLGDPPSDIEREDL